MAASMLVLIQRFLVDARIAGLDKAPPGSLYRGQQIVVPTQWA